MRAGKILVAVALAYPFSAACGSRSLPPVFGDGASDGAGSDGGAASATSTVGLPCTTDQDCGAGGVCDPSSRTCACGGVAVAANRIPANVLLVEDRSCSMADAVAKGGPSKWTIAVSAINSLTQTFAGRLRFGLTLFPDNSGDKCSQAAIPIPVDDGNEPKIQSLLSAALSTSDANYPSGPCVTPIDSAMVQAATEPAFADPTRQSFAVLITDGKQSACSSSGGNAGTVKAIAGLVARGVHTFVIGFGGAVDVKSLESFAVAGAEINAAGPHKFYEAQDATGLDAALASIAESALSCDLALGAAPPQDDPSLIFVYFDHATPAIPRDTAHGDGWDYDAATNRLRFYGDACDKIKSGAVSSESVVFGCPGSGAPPTLH